MSFKIALLLDPVTGLHHPAHQWVSVQAYLPFTPLTMLFINIVTIPLVEVRDGSLVPLQNESHRSQRLDRVLYGKPETHPGRNKPPQPGARDYVYPQVFDLLHPRGMLMTALDAARPLTFSSLLRANRKASGSRELRPKRLRGSAARKSRTRR